MTFLRDLNAVLWIDAASCALMGAALLGLGQALSAPTGLPPALLLWAGALLLPVALLIAVAARRRPVPRPLLLLIVAGNAAWVAASLLVAALLAPTALGLALLLAQAVAVAGLTLLEARGLRARAAA